MPINFASGCWKALATITKPCDDGTEGAGNRLLQHRRVKSGTAPKIINEVRMAYVLNNDDL
jgi:hypothetical protein